MDKQREGGKERGVEGASELQIVRDRDRDERARDTERAERESALSRSEKEKSKEKDFSQERFLSGSLPCVPWLRISIAFCIL